MTPRKLPALRGAVPNGMIRSGLFSVKRLGADRDFLRDFAVSTQDSNRYAIKFTGEELNQMDCQAFYAVLRHHRRSGAEYGEWVPTVLSDLIADVGLPRCSSSYEWIRESLLRLNQGRLLISSNGIHYAGHLVSELLIDEATRKVQIKLAPAIATLFDKDCTYVNLSAKAGLKSLIAKWLFDFYSSHQQTIPVSIDRLAEMMRSPLPRNQFKRQLEKALDELSDCPDCPFVGYDLRNRDLLIYKRVPKGEVEVQH